MSTFKNLLFCVSPIITFGTMVAIGWMFSAMGGRINSLRDQLATANETIAILQTANNQQASQLATLARDETVLRTLLGSQNVALAELDQLNRKTADELQQALLTPPAGRPNCASEPLPVGALRLLQPAPDRGANQGGEAATAAGAGTKLPGT